MQQGPQGYGPPQGYPQQGYPQQPPPKQGMPTWLKVLIVLGVLGLCGMGGCLVCIGAGAKAVGDAVETAQASAKKAEETKKQADDAAKATAPLVKIEDLIAAYKANEVSADEKYKGKFLVTVGVVDEVKKDITDRMYVILVPLKAEPFLIPKIQCYPPESQKSEAAALVKGKPLTIRGQVDGLLFNVQVKDCELNFKRQK